MSESPLLQIREPRAEEFSIIERRFPQLLDKDNSAELFVADRSDMQGTMAGWMVMKFFPNKQSPEKAILLVHVNQQLRRQGIGSALMDNAIEIAHDAGASILTHMRPILGGSTSENFLKSKGFVQTFHFTTYELETEKVLEVIKPTYEKLLTRNRFSEEENLFWAENIAFKHELTDCIRENLAHLSPQLEERLDSDLDSFTQSASPVVVYQGRIVGLILTTVSDTHATVDATAVAKEFRNTWVNVALKYQLASAVHALGIRKIQLGTNEKLHPDSNRLVEKTNAELLLNQCHYELAL